MPRSSPTNPDPALLSKFQSDLGAVLNEVAFAARHALISRASPRPVDPSPALIAARVAVPELPESIPDPDSQRVNTPMDANPYPRFSGRARSKWENEMANPMMEHERLMHEAMRQKHEWQRAHDAVGRFLMDARWPHFKVGDDPLRCILEFAKHSQSLAIENFESFQKAESQHAALEEQVRDLTAGLADLRRAGTDVLKKAVQDQSTGQAEIERLQEIIDTQHDKYRDALQSENERHSATVDRLINEHTTEMSEQMSSYEKELVELRMAHDRGLAQREQRHRLELDLLHDRMMALEGSLGEKPADPLVVANESTMRQADKPVVVRRDSFGQMEKPASPPVMANGFGQKGKPANPPILANDSTTQGIERQIRSMVLSVGETKRLVGNVVSESLGR